MYIILEKTMQDRNILRDLANNGDTSWQRLLSKNAPQPQAEAADPPGNFHFPYLISRPTPYLSCDGDGREQVCGGVLQTNQVVWLDQPLHDIRSPRRVSAFTAGLGVIRLDARRLSVFRKPA